jgi:CubicO group peptidase (beta-lactamase class C family)
LQYSAVYSGGPGLSLGYGLGFQVLRRGTLVLLGHFGATPGYVSAAIVDRETRSGIVALSSVREGGLDVNEVAMQMLEILAASQASIRR